MSMEVKSLMKTHIMEHSKIIKHVSILTHRNLCNINLHGKK